MAEWFLKLPLFGFPCAQMVCSVFLSLTHRVRLVKKTATRHKTHCYQLMGTGSGDGRRRKRGREGGRKEGRKEGQNGAAEEWVKSFKHDVPIKSRKAFTQTCSYSMG